MTVVLAWFQPSIKRIDEFETNARVALLNSPQSSTLLENVENCLKISKICQYCVAC